jgi:hypothetical protein
MTPSLSPKVTPFFIGPEGSGVKLDQYTHIRSYACSYVSSNGSLSGITGLADGTKWSGETEFHLNETDIRVYVMDTPLYHTVRGTEQPTRYLPTARGFDEVSGIFGW